MSCLTCALLWGLMLGEQGEPAHCISLSVRWQPVIVAQGDQDGANSQFCRPSFPLPPLNKCCFLAELRVLDSIRLKWD